MGWRMTLVLLSQILAAALGWFLTFEGDPVKGALLAAVLAGYLLHALDMVRAARLLRWLRDGVGTPLQMAGGVWGEVTDRVRRLVRTRERLTQESDDRLQDFLAAMQASPNGVVLLDSEGRIEWFNQVAGMHFGLDAARDMLQHFGNLVRDPDFAAYSAARDFSRDVVMQGTQSHQSMPIRLSVHLHPYGDGRSMLLSRDITLVEQAEAMRRDFVANVSHEIRTPLTVLAGFVETLQTLSLDAEDRARYLALMSVQAERMQSLVSDLLTLSRLEGSPLPALNEWVSMQILMDQCAQDAQNLSRLVTGGQHPMEFEPAPHLALAGSANELYSAMFNLVSNAVRYTPAGQEIRVWWSVPPEGGARFSVQDSGPGIAQEHIPRLTERFYRVDRSRSRDTGGTGLGLAIVKHVAQRHGGELSIQSTLGKGSTFCISFPVSRVRQEVQAASAVQ